MKILQVATPYLEVKKENIKSGITTICYQLTEELIKKGHKVVLFAPRHSKTSAPLVESTTLAFDHHKIIHPYQNDLLHLFSILAKAIKYAQKNNFDIIHSHLPSVAPALNLISPLPIVTTMHWGIFLPHEKDYLKITPYHYFVAISHKQRKRLPFIKFIGTVHNGINLEDFKFNPKPKDYFLAYGAINELKGTEKAIEIAKRTKINLKIFGTIRDKEYFSKKIKPYLNKKIVYGGEILTAKKRNEILGKAKALLFTPTWHEPFGLTLIEAQACGTPVLALDKGAVREVIRNNKTGFIAKNIDEIIKKIPLINKINRQDCRKFVEKNFTCQKMAKEYEKIYQKVIQDFKKKQKYEN